jgi:shikimate kinase
MDLVLMGLRGSGKSTLGRRLASTYRLRFVDLDERTPGLLGVRSVSEAWTKHGEAAFREAEVRALRAVIAEDPDILALGGGTPMAPGVRGLVSGLKSESDARSRVVYLRADAPVLRERLAGKMAGRPSLTGGDPLGEIEAVLAVRDPVYCALADQVIDVGELNEDESLALLVGILGL